MKPGGHPDPVAGIGLDLFTGRSGRLVSAVSRLPSSRRPRAAAKRVESKPRPSGGESSGELEAQGPGRLPGSCCAACPNSGVRRCSGCSRRTAEVKVS